ncbi:2-hydroxyacid dehydrogenase [Pedobacter suwonensis]|uniref:2-hydroxyacid dehydrogenase n=1 Tax=Pedobacter suwonensis TaxID=332999 RepID=UPI0036BDCA5A
MDVLTTRLIPKNGLQILKDAGCMVTQYTEKRDLTSKELIYACKRYDALLSVGPNKIDEHFLTECRHLKAISLLSAGYDNVDVSAANQMGIAIGYTPGVLSAATSDIAFLLMLAVSRNAFYQHNTIAKGEWGFFEPTANLGIELYGKTLGIFGLGKIGFELAKKCRAAYQMKLIYHNRHSNEAVEKELGATLVTFDELLAKSDVLSVHAGLSAQTRGLFSKEIFEKMKSTAIFINTARGAIHNEEDLLAALQQGKIWGAGLDVTNPEPMSSNNPLLSLRNVCVLPHIGSATVETRNAMAVIAAKNIIAGLRGEQMPHVVNPEVYRR